MVSPLISVDELADALVTGAVPVLLDVRWSLTDPDGRRTHAAGHIPGARFVDLDRQLAAPPGPGRHPMPAREAFQSAMRSFGVSRDSAVVVYDAGDGTAAARAWWLLRYFGHAAVRLLDGGFAAWAAAGRPVVTGEEPPATEGDFEAVPGGMPVMDADGAASLARRGVLVDARAAERFRGEVEPIDPVAGHIPGARSLPTTGNVGTDGRFLDPAELRQRFADIGAVDGAEVGAYCGSGVTAAHEVLAGELAGLRLALYPGSWSEWITEPRRPVETGDATGVARSTVPKPPNR